MFFTALSWGAYLHLAEVKWVKTGVPRVKPLSGVKRGCPLKSRGDPFTVSHSVNNFFIFKRRSPKIELALVQTLFIVVECLYKPSKIYHNPFKIEFRFFQLNKYFSKSKLNFEFLESTLQFKIRTLSWAIVVIFTRTNFKWSWTLYHQTEWTKPEEKSWVNILVEIKTVS